jgi:hypothetical protein
MKFFSSADFTFPAGNNDINSWADYCEFFCIISEDKSRSIEELKDRLLDQHQKDYKEARNSIRLTGSTTGKFIISSMDIIEGLDSDKPEGNAIESDFSDVDEHQQSNDSEVEDDINNEFLFLLRFLEARKNLFADSYPFIVRIKDNKFSLQVKSITGKQKIYIALLLSSILRIYTPSIRNKLGHLFEELSLFPFKKMIASNSKIEFFGAGKKTAGKAFFNGSFSTRVEKLAETLKSDTTTLFKQNRHDYMHSGDGGLDWVAWTPFTDGRSKMPVFFGQCACGNDWVDKEWDAHDDKWINLIQLNDSYLLFHFIGKSFRKQDGNWYRPGDIYKMILVDRLRIISLLNEEDYGNVIFLYEELIEEALKIKLSEND